MISRWQTWIFALAAASAATTPAPAQVEPIAPPSLAPPRNVVQWVRGNAVAVGYAGSRPDAAERRAIAHIVGNARIVGLGESGHGYREPLQYRNRLIRHLVEHEGLTAVALESGLAESKSLYDYVLGGRGDATILTRAGLTHQFGFIPENVELIEWLRAYNAAHPRRRVHFYGIDLSTIQSAPPGAKGYGIILDRIEAYLALTVPIASRSARGGLARFKSRFSEADYRDWSEADRADAALMLRQVQQLFITHRERMVRATSRDEYDWAERLSYDARQLPQVFATWVDDPFQLEKLLKLVSHRDQAMANHTLWVLKREGPRGKILLFQANGHITADTLVGSVMRSFPRQPKLTGTLLREALGNRYRAIATVSSWGRSKDDRSLGSVDRAFAAVGRSPVLLDLRAPGRSAWWSRLQSASQGNNRVDDLVPTRAFDALLYVNRLTPLPPPPKK